jgi:twitching motility protein PilT
VFDVDAALRHLVSVGGSDLHLKVPMKPLVRLDGELQPVEQLATLTAQDTEDAVKHMLHDERRLAEWATDGEVDFSYAIEGVARFRVNAFRQRGWASLVIRAIPVTIRTIEELSLPPVIRELAEEERGIVLLTGTTGSGKSTTLAAMIDHINTTMRKHVMTIEDPIEFLHEDKRSAINQREVGADTESFRKALRRVLRQDPDIILIGEMRDEETVHTALSAAETGHLVFSTVHTVDAVETVNRLVDFFPPHMHQQVRAMLAGTLKGAVSQRLVPTASGKGRLAVCEVLRMTGRVRDMIMDPEETGKLNEVIADGGYYGMQTFDQALFGHLKAGRITMEQAMAAASSPHDFKLLCAADGRRGTTMAELEPLDEAAAAAARPAGSAAPPASVSSAPPRPSTPSPAMA